MKSMLSVRKQSHGNKQEITCEVKEVVLFEAHGNSTTASFAKLKKATPLRDFTPPVKGEEGLLFPSCYTGITGALTDR